MDAKTDEKAGKCPVVHGTTNVGMRSNSDWWPNQLNLRILRQNSPQSDPMGKAARSEGFTEIADWFETLAKAERSHANRFQKALDALAD